MEWLQHFKELIDVINGVEEGTLAHAFILILFLIMMMALLIAMAFAIDKFTKNQKNLNDPE